MSTKRNKRERVDRLLVEQGLAESRTRAQALLLGGRVFVGEQRIDKAGTLVAVDAPLSVRGTMRYVSRGGLKLEGALKALNVEVQGKVAVDIGASTGGFTDCLLQHGAAKVFAIDVGQGQLAQSLRNDERVVVMERCNARHLGPQSLGEAVDLVVVDASFIGLEKFFEAFQNILKRPGELVALIKPQFEVGKREASKHKGVIRDEALRNQAIQGALDKLAEFGFELMGDCACAIKGPKGNQEHFVRARLTTPK
jgi:23S rRNA (cytidine1920-2'-O)/16S rRNA (cytidine1409-2'-O)-methyltransferase